MRALPAIFVVFALLAAFAMPAAASCAPPAPTSENASRAEAVVYGTVTGGDRSRVTFRVERVLKGSAGGSLVAYLGPTRGGGASSVDYTAPAGTDHVLYLVRASDGQLETNACIGSHSGPATNEENAHFGAGTTPSGTAATAAPAAPGPAAPGLPDTGTTALVWILPALTIGLLVLLLARRRISTR